MRRVAYLAALAAMAVSLAGCQSFREAAGLVKEPPDEFAVVTKAPLIIPPDYNLKPPRPGAPPTNQLPPTATAEAALYGKKAIPGIHGQLSAGEQELLAKAGATDASNMIRQKIAADNRAMQAADNSFTNQILFGYGTDYSAGVPVNANAEKRRLDAARAAGNSTGPAKPAKPPATIEKDSGGWLDGIF